MLCIAGAFSYLPALPRSTPISSAWQTPARGSRPSVGLWRWGAQFRRRPCVFHPSHGGRVFWLALLLWRSRLAAARSAHPRQRSKLAAPRQRLVAAAAVPRRRNRCRSRQRPAPTFRASAGRRRQPLALALAMSRSPRIRSARRLPHPAAARGRFTIKQFDVCTPAATTNGVYSFYSPVANLGGMLGSRLGAGDDVSLQWRVASVVRRSLLLEERQQVALCLAGEGDGARQWVSLIPYAAGDSSGGANLRFKPGSLQRQDLDDVSKWRTGRLCAAVHAGWVGRGWWRCP